jgi:uncharacterized protein YneF (UPF0154 family)
MSAYYRGEPLPEVNQYDPEPVNKKTTTKATPVYKEWWFWLIIIVIVVVVLVGLGIGIYFLVKELTKSTYQIPANTPNVSTSLAASNGSFQPKSGTCVLATNANAIGWQIINNSQFSFLHQIVGAAITGCNNANWGSNTIPANSTVNWYDKFDGNSTSYFTYYPGCKITFLNQTSTININLQQFLPSTINPANQYVKITVTNNLDNTGIQAKAEIITI